MIKISTIHRRSTCAAAVALSAFALAPSASALYSDQLVPVELVLLVDTSGSVDASEYELQQQGYVQAFRHPDLISLIEGQGGLAVCYVEWSDADHQDLRVGWTLLKNNADCLAFANQIDNLARISEGSTRMAPALEFAASQIRDNSYVSLRRVIDVSGDGECQNQTYYEENPEFSAEYGKPWNDVISELSGAVDLVNGICITTDADIVDFYQNDLPQGDAAFMMQVDDFDEFEEAILEKLVREISKVPGMFD